MPMNPGMYSSDKDDWGTPQWLFDRLDKVFHFDIDVCASPWNAKADLWIGEGQNALLRSWTELAGPRMMGWMNPPYGRTISKWMGKLYLEWEQGAQFVALLPARTDTLWFQYYADAAWGVLFLKGRLRYEYRCAYPDCDEITLWLYGPGRGKTIPFCAKHGEQVGKDRLAWAATTRSVAKRKELEAPWKRRRSTAPFPSCLVFFLHDREPGLEKLLTLQDLGMICHPRPSYGVGNITAKE
jgi:phage N-6-adenine-methyltransferase